MPLALRKDFSINNESLLFVIASRNLGGRDCSQEQGSDSWNELVRDGIFLPMTLVGDKGVNLRVLVNEDLSSQERDEAASHFAARLQVDDGCLTCFGGSEHLNGEDSREHLETMQIPRGDYRADVFSCFAGVNGPYLTEFQRKELREPLGAWFRRTRPKTEFPRWLSDYCRAHPASDPGHERMWIRREPMEMETCYFDQPDYLDFIVRLIPWTRANAIEPPELDENGCIVPMPLMPSICPIGITLQAVEI